MQLYGDNWLIMSLASKFRQLISLEFTVHQNTCVRQTKLASSAPPVFSVTISFTLRERIVADDFLALLNSYRAAKCLNNRHIPSIKDLWTYSQIQGWRISEQSISNHMANLIKLGTTSFIPKSTIRDRIIEDFFFVFQDIFAKIRQSGTVPTFKSIAIAYNNTIFYDSLLDTPLSEQTIRRLAKECGISYHEGDQLSKYHFLTNSHYAKHRNIYFVQLIDDYMDGYLIIFYDETGLSLGNNNSLQLTMLDPYTGTVLFPQISQQTNKFMSIGEWTRIGHANGVLEDSKILAHVTQYQQQQHKTSSKSPPTLDNPPKKRLDKSKPKKTSTSNKATKRAKACPSIETDSTIVSLTTLDSTSETTPDSQMATKTHSPRVQNFPPLIFKLHHHYMLRVHLVVCKDFVISQNMKNWAWTSPLGISLSQLDLLTTIAPSRRSPVPIVNKVEEYLAQPPVNFWKYPGSIENAEIEAFLRLVIPQPDEVYLFHPHEVGVWANIQRLCSPKKNHEARSWANLCDCQRKALSDLLKPCNNLGTVSFKSLAKFDHLNPGLATLCHNYVSQFHSLFELIIHMIYVSTSDTVPYAYTAHNDGEYSYPSLPGSSSHKRNIVRLVRHAISNQFRDMDLNIIIPKNTFYIMGADHHVVKGVGSLKTFCNVVSHYSPNFGSKHDANEHKTDSLHLITWLISKFPSLSPEIGLDGTPLLNINILYMLCYRNNVHIREYLDRDQLDDYDRAIDPDNFADLTSENTLNPLSVQISPSSIPLTHHSTVNSEIFNQALESMVEVFTASGFAKISVVFDQAAFHVKVMDIDPTSEGSMYRLQVSGNQSKKKYYIEWLSNYRIVYNDIIQFHLALRPDKTTRYMVDDGGHTSRIKPNPYKTYSTNEVYSLIQQLQLMECNEDGSTRAIHIPQSLGKSSLITPVDCQPELPILRFELKDDSGDVLEPDIIGDRSLSNDHPMETRPKPIPTHIQQSFRRSNPLKPQIANYFDTNQTPVAHAPKSGTAKQRAPFPELNQVITSEQFDDYWSVNQLKNLIAIIACLRGLDSKRYYKEIISNIIKRSTGVRPEIRVLLTPSHHCDWNLTEFKFAYIKQELSRTNFSNLESKALEYLSISSRPEMQTFNQNWWVHLLSLMVESMDHDISNGYTSSDNYDIDSNLFKRLLQSMRRSRR